ncbi:type IV pilus modification protein PilV [Nitrosomonas sp. Is37]|uniref:type IV pilus modification protein PilV n=1 Tax=Nitrosomonas sp. Is37 TaxID=3080535 RepID=UPI00294B13FD|nr:type IV pilus modification protein PilV [Nitrosomonas sp. Is37]MDV6344629.1 type IV pilus modification protein PilV [Nitrosomonas sp. Is37]
MLILKKKFQLPHQKGVTMIEVLVAIVVLSIGLLGLAGLQSVGLTHNQSASFRSTATMMTYSILDSMRANRTAAINGSYNIAIGASIPSGSTIPEQDLNNWLNELALRLPAGTGAINVAGNVITVTIQWDDSRGGALAAQQFILTTQL